jgi:hypothetical protein
MKPTKPRFLVADPDSSITIINARIVSTQIEGEWYVFYRHEDGSTMLMPRDMYCKYLAKGFIVEPGKPEDIPGLSSSGRYINQ